MRKGISAAIGVLMLSAGHGLAAPAAHAAILDFSGNICGAAGDQACGDYSQIGQNYGDTAQVDVSYRAANATTGVTTEAFLKYWASGYGDLQGIVWGGGDPGSSFSEIVFTPAAGYEISLISLDAGCYGDRSSCQTLNYDVLTGDGQSLFAGAASTLYPGHATLAVNSAYSANGIVLRWGPDGYDVGLDNIAFDVRAIGPGAVPEPSSWAMMIAGFGLVGGAMRRGGARVARPA